MNVVNYDNQCSDIVSEFTTKISHTVEESETEFIFQTLINYVAREYQIIVDKSELEKAIMLIKSSREYGNAIDQHSYAEGYRDSILYMEEKSKQLLKK